MRSPLVQSLALFSAQEEMSHNKRTDNDFAWQGQHCLEESPKNQILICLKPFASSEADTAASEEATSPVPTGTAAISLPQLWSGGRAGLHLMRPALKPNTFPCVAHN